MPKEMLSLSVSLGDKFDENITIDLLRMILWPDALQNLLKPSKMQSTWSLAASTNSNMSFAKSRCDTEDPSLDARNGFHLPLSTSQWFPPSSLLLAVDPFADPLHT